MSNNITYVRVNNEEIVSEWEGDESGPFNPQVREVWVNNPEWFEVVEPEA